MTKLAALCVSFSLLCEPVFAAGGPQWEISGGTHAPLTIASSGTSTVTSFALSAAAGYFVTPSVQISFSPGVSVVSSGGTVSVITLMLGPSINFGGGEASPRDAFTLGVQIGFVATTPGSTYFSYGISLGKGIPITSSISYKPGIGIVGIASGPASTIVVLSPLAFSLFL